MQLPDFCLQCVLNIQGWLPALLLHPCGGPRFQTRSAMQYGMIQALHVDHGRERPGSKTSRLSPTWAGPGARPRGASLSATSAPLENAGSERLDAMPAID